MIEYLFAETENIIRGEKTALKIDVASGSNVSITVQNTQGYKPGDYIAIGHEGTETCELQTIVTVDDDITLTVATIKFNHRDGEPLTQYRYNKRKFYGATSKDGTYTELTSDGSPKDIQVDHPQGTLLEYTGDTYTYFKATYYNSTENTETALSDSDAVSTDTSQRYTTLYEIQKQAGLVGNPFISDALVDIYRDRAENEVNSYLVSRYVLPLETVPGIINNATTLLAAGYMDYQEFGAEGEGKKWLGEARGLLKAISKGTQRLLGENGELPTIDQINTVTGYPNSPDDGFNMDIAQKF